MLAEIVGTSESSELKLNKGDKVYIDTSYAKTEIPDSGNDKLYIISEKSLAFEG